MIECKVRPDGRKGGRWQYGYDGRDFISFDMEHLVWTAADPQAQVIMRTWETETGLVLRLRSYLEEMCTAWFQKDSAYREEGLRKGKGLRTCGGGSRFPSCALVLALFTSPPSISPRLDW